MGSWGDNTARRADRMPSIRAKASMNKQPGPPTTDDVVRNAMMNDLGTIRINELPLDDTQNPRAIPPRPRRPPVITEPSEALNGYIDMAENGINDAEAMAVRDLDDLGGPSHRPTAGAARNHVAAVRCPTLSSSGMQTSPNGILIPPGAVVHRFARGNAPSAQASEQPLPPHLRVKKKMETPLASKSSPENGESVEVTKPVTTDIFEISHAREIKVRLPPTVSPMELRKDQGVHNQSQKIQSSVNTVKHDHTSGSNGSNDDEVLIFWTGSCKTWVPDEGKDCDATIDLKIINAPVGTKGQALFFITLPGGAVKKHNMSSYVLEITRNNLCAIKFSNPDGRYRLKFQDEATATYFNSRAELLQKVTGYLDDVAAAGGIGVEVSSATEQNGAREKQLSCNISATAAPAESSAGISKQPKAAIETNKSQATAKDNEHFPKKLKDSTDIITDAFNNLSLNNVKDADMYKANRQRVSYSAEELLKKRSSARAPAGITDVEIPLNRQDKQPRNASSTQDVLERDHQSKKSPTIHDSVKVKDWIAGKRPQSKTEGSSQVPMPGLSEAVQYQKAAAAITKSSTQASERPLSEKKPVNVVTDKDGTAVDGTPEKNDKGSAKDKTQMAATATGNNPSTSKSTDADASIEHETDVDQATTVVEDSISAEPKNPDNRAADSDASSDSAVGLQPSSKDEHPSTITINPNDQTKMENTAPSFNSEVPAPDATIVTDEQGSSAKETPAMFTEVPGQTVPAASPIATPTTSFAVHTNIPSGVQGQCGPGMQAVMPVPHLASQQTPSPLLATPHMAQPHVTYTPQMDAHSMIPGLQCPPAGIIHSVSITYHISYPGQPNGQPLNAGQENAGTIHHVTDLTGQQTGRAFSPNAQVFQPQRQPSQRGSGQNRMRRGLDGSIFATGNSGAKHAGSFTGARSE
ncbi:hypothetical protein LX36DRAFT_706515 [Colletotrichum falcatum]|nr:hypothetical protein LX36DRAFT_706515 [Colletotrichum falcatum]